MNYPIPPRRQCPEPVVVHNVVCHHRIEIEVWPSAAEVYFHDERYVDPVNTQVRFQAAVYNAPSSSVIWEVQDVDGGPGPGWIDSTGLYVAPLKGTIPHGTTVIVIATAADDPLRKAFARVTLIGFGPEPPPPPKLDIFPKQAYIYYPVNQVGTHNEFIDVSNKMQMFRATIRNSDSTALEWFVDSGAGYVQQPGATDPWYLYLAGGSGPNGQEVMVKVQLSGHADVYDEARLILINYTWPGYIAV